MIVLFITKEEKVTTTVTALLVLFAVTIAVAAAILIYKFTGDRAEFRIPAMALEIFIGMYLFRVLANGAVGWILGFVVAAAQGLPFPQPGGSTSPVSLALGCIRVLDRRRVVSQSFTIPSLAHPVA